MSLNPNIEWEVRQGLDNTGNDPDNPSILATQTFCPKGQNYPRITITVRESVGGGYQLTSDAKVSEDAWWNAVGIPRSLLVYAHRLLGRAAHVLAHQDRVAELRVQGFAIDQLKVRRLYRIHSRNLRLGVFFVDPHYREYPAGFLGIRTKFGSRFIDGEYHWEQGAPFGTAFPTEDLGIDLPDNIELRRSLDTVDEATRRPVEFDKSIADGGRGWYFTDTGEASKDIRAVATANEALFTWLEEQEKRFLKGEDDGEG